MARNATLTMSDKSFLVGLKKLDRKKIYGWSNIDIFDSSDQVCKLASITDGQHILPSGSITLAGFNLKGEYIAKSSLVGVDKEGKKVEKVPSIFDEPAALTKTDLDAFLSLNVKSVYQLGIEEGKEELLGLLAGGNIYHFLFNYRADYEADDAFLLSGSGEVFAIVGKKAELEFIGLENKEEEVPEEPEAETPEEDFDFGML
jgi:hypothetical protein